MWGCPTPDRSIFATLSHHMPTELDLGLIERCISGEGSPDDVRALADWERRAHRHEIVANALRRVWSVDGEERPGDAERMVERVSAAVRARGPGASPAVTRPLFSRSGESIGARHRRFARTAGFSIAVAAGIAALMVGYGRSGDRPAATEPLSVAREIVTLPGERASIRLKDGSSVTLGFASRLRIPAEFAGTTRNVQLEGEAYFEVRHDSRMPFTVATATSATEALGTTFLVREYAAEREARVVVSEGRVALRSVALGPGQGTILKSGDLGRLTRGGQTSVESGVQTDRYLSWMEGGLVFDNTPLREAIADIERQYDVEIRLRDRALARRRITATFRNEQLSNVLGVLSFMLDVTPHRRGRVITLSSSSSPKP